MARGGFTMRRLMTPLVVLIMLLFLVQHPSAEEKKTSKQAKGGSAWKCSTKIDAMDDCTNIIASSESLTRFQSTLGSKSVSLVLRCQKRETDVYLSFGTVLEGYDDGVMIRIRYDKEEPKEYFMNEATSLDAAFFVYPMEFIKEALRHKKMLVEFTPFQQGPTAVLFNLTEMKPQAK